MLVRVTKAGRALVCALVFVQLACCGGQLSPQQETEARKAHQSSNVCVIGTISYIGPKHTSNVVTTRSLLIREFTFLSHVSAGNRPAVDAGSVWVSVAQLYPEFEFKVGQKILVWGRWVVFLSDPPPPLDGVGRALPLRGEKVNPNGGVSEESFRPYLLIEVVLEELREAEGPIGGIMHYSDRLAAFARGLQAGSSSSGQ